MDSLRFTIPEILSLIGIAQCVYIIVYMLFRSGRISRGGLAMAYFLVLAIAFFSDFARLYIGEFSHYFYIQWAAWFMGPPLSVLLIIQVAQISKVPSLKYYFVLALVPLVWLVSMSVGQDNPMCQGYNPCEDRVPWLILGGMLAGCVSLLTIWLNRGLLEGMTGQKTGKERYWLILSVVVANVALLFVTLFNLSPDIRFDDLAPVRTAIGLGLVYLVSTSLFRIYPQAVRIADRVIVNALSDDEQGIAQKVEELLSLQKVYQEPTYSRTDLARECSTSETTLSKIINIHFEKSFPQLMNEHRVEDAKRLLKETDANVKTIAEEVGFNSIASFNRVFKDFSGLTPSQFRKKAA